MRYFVLPILLTAAIAGCSQKQPPAPPAADVNAGKALAESNCAGCHHMDGKGAAPGIPNLAAQSQSYLVASLNAYKDDKRTHAALKDMAQHLSDDDLRNVVGYYASLPPLPYAGEKEAASSPYDKGSVLSQKCSSCHGTDGNSTTAGIPSLAGQQPRYFVTAVQAYLHGVRSISTMEDMLRGLSKIDLENLAVYYAAQTPAKRVAPTAGDPAAGEPLSANCGGCHGAKGVSNDAAIPTLAGQDAQYLVSATKAYRDGTVRHHDDMQKLLSDSSDKGIEDIAAFYAIQTSKPADTAPLSIQKLAENCDRCHAPGQENPSMAIPKISGQDRDYLIIALRAYRDGKRESSPMHKMSLPYSDTVIDSIATWYTNQPAK